MKVEFTDEVTLVYHEFSNFAFMNQSTLVAKHTFFGHGRKIVSFGIRHACPPNSDKISSLNLSLLIEAIERLK